MTFYGGVLQNPRGKGLWNITENKYFFCVLISRSTDKAKQKNPTNQQNPQS